MIASANSDNLECVPVWRELRAMKRGESRYFCRPIQIAAEIARRRDDDFHHAILEPRRIPRAATSGETPANPQHEQVGSAWLALDAVGVLNTPRAIASEAEIPLLKEESHGVQRDHCRRSPLCNCDVPSLARRNCSGIRSAHCAWSWRNG